MPIKKRTAELGNHASLIPIWDPICSDKSWFEDILVTIIAVDIASNKDGIWATKPSPTDKII